MQSSMPGEAVELERAWGEPRLWYWMGRPSSVLATYWIALPRLLDLSRTLGIHCEGLLRGFSDTRLGECGSAQQRHTIMRTASVPLAPSNLHILVDPVTPFSRAWAG